MPFPIFTACVFRHSDIGGKVSSDNHGVYEDGLDYLADEIINRTEKSMREAIRKVPDGVYEAEGIAEQGKGKEDIVIKAAVHATGSDIMVDLEGSSPQAEILESDTPLIIFC